MKALSDIRLELDEIDRKMTELYCQRLSLMQEVAAYKQAHQLPVYDPKREAQKADALAEQAAVLDPAARDGMRALYGLLCQHAKERQRQWLADHPVSKP